MVSHDVDFIRRLTLTQAFNLKDGELEKLEELPELEGYEKQEAKKVPAVQQLN